MRGGETEIKRGEFSKQIDNIDGLEMGLLSLRMISDSGGGGTAGEMPAVQRVAGR